MACGLLLSEVMQGEPRLLEFCLFVVHASERFRSFIILFATFLKCEKVDALVIIEPLNHIRKRCWPCLRITENSTISFSLLMSWKPLSINCCFVKFILNLFVVCLAKVRNLFRYPSTKANYFSFLRKKKREAPLSLPPYKRNKWVSIP